jgi:hypothetical protein
MTSNTSSNSTTKDFLNLSISKIQKTTRSSEQSNEIIPYYKAKEKLFDIWYLKPTVEQISKSLKLMYGSLSEEWGFLSKKEIIAKIVNDAFPIGLSKTKIKQLLFLEEF